MMKTDKTKIRTEYERNIQTEAQARMLDTKNLARSKCYDKELHFSGWK